METLIDANLLLRLLNIQEFFTHQWLMFYPNDRQKIAELIKIKKQQLSLQDLINQQNQEEESGSGGGGGTIRGFRAKNDKNIQDRHKSPSARRMNRK